MLVCFITGEHCCIQKALVSKCDTSAVKHPPAVPLGWYCDKNK